MKAVVQKRRAARKVWEAKDAYLSHIWRMLPFEDVVKTQNVSPDLNEYLRTQFVPLLDQLAESRILMQHLTWSALWPMVGRALTSSDKDSLLISSRMSNHRFANGLIAHILSHGAPKVRKLKVVLHDIDMAVPESFKWITNNLRDFDRRWIYRNHIRISPPNRFARYNVSSEYLVREGVSPKVETLWLSAPWLHPQYLDYEVMRARFPKLKTVYIETDEEPLEIRTPIPKDLNVIILLNVSLIHLVKIWAMLKKAPPNLTYCITRLNLTQIDLQTACSWFFLDLKRIVSKSHHKSVDNVFDLICKRFSVQSAGVPMDVMLTQSDLYEWILETMTKNRVPAEPKPSLRFEMSITFPENPSAITFRCQFRSRHPIYQLTYPYPNRKYYPIKDFSSYSLCLVNRVPVQEHCPEFDGVGPIPHFVLDEIMQSRFPRGTKWPENVIPVGMINPARFKEESLKKWAAMLKAAGIRHLVVDVPFITPKEMGMLYRIGKYARDDYGVPIKIFPQTITNVNRDALQAIVDMTRGSYTHDYVGTQENPFVFLYRNPLDLDDRERILLRDNFWRVVFERYPAWFNRVTTKTFSEVWSYEDLVERRPHHYNETAPNIVCDTIVCPPPSWNAV